MRVRLNWLFSQLQSAIGHFQGRAESLVIASSFYEGFPLPLVDWFHRPIDPSQSLPSSSWRPRDSFLRGSSRSVSGRVPLILPKVET